MLRGDAVEGTRGPRTRGARPARCRPLPPRARGSRVIQGRGLGTRRVVPRRVARPAERKRPEESARAHAPRPRSRRARSPLVHNVMSKCDPPAGQNTPVGYVCSFSLPPVVAPARLLLDISLLRNASQCRPPHLAPKASQSRARPMRAPLAPLGITPRPSLTVSPRGPRRPCERIKHAGPPPPSPSPIIGVMQRVATARQPEFGIAPSQQRTSSVCVVFAGLPPDHHQRPSVRAKQNRTQKPCQCARAPSDTSTQGDTGGRARYRPRGRRRRPRPRASSVEITALAVPASPASPAPRSPPGR